MSIIWFIILARTVPTESLRKWKFNIPKMGVLSLLWLIKIS